MAGAMIMNGARNKGITKGVRLAVVTAMATLSVFLPASVLIAQHENSPRPAPRSSAPSQQSRPQFTHPQSPRQQNQNQGQSAPQYQNRAPQQYPNRAPQPYPNRAPQPYGNRAPQQYQPYRPPAGGQMQRPVQNPYAPPAGARSAAPYPPSYDGRAFATGFPADCGHSVAAPDAHSSDRAS